MRKKRIIALLCVLLPMAPLWAVFKENNLNQTLSVLLMELKETYAGLQKFSGSAEQRIQEQHQKLAQLVDECNELSVILYSQASENTFDLTFALNEVTRQYEQFKSESTPYAEVRAKLTDEMERYNRLVLTLRKMPPERTAQEIVQENTVAVALDSATTALADSTILDTPEFARDVYEMKMDDATIAVRDSCLYVAEQIVAYYWLQMQQIDKDNEYYEQTDELLKSAYNYAQDRYKAVQQKLFVEGQGNYFKTLARFPFRARRAMADVKNRYSLNLDEDSVVSSWRGPIVFFYSFMLLLVLLLSTLVSTLLVNGYVKYNKKQESAWFMEHKGLVIALLGVLLFGVFLFINTKTSAHSFIVRSSTMMGEFAWLMAAILVSMLIRLDKSRIRSTLMAYLPTLIMAFVVLYFRMIFIPNSVINLLFPALLLLSTIYQFWMVSRKSKMVDRGDLILLWASSGAMAVATLISWAGLVMGSLLLIIWWMFQLALLESVIAVWELLSRYYESRLKEVKLAYRKKNPSLPLSNGKASFIEVSWLYDLVKMVLVPVLGIWSFPSSVFKACKVFNFTGVARQIFFAPFVKSENGFSVSVLYILIIISLFFLFRYLIYAAKAFYRVWKTKSAIRKLGEDVVFKETDVNYNLANNIISLLAWGLFVLIIFLLLQIPASGLALVSTGLATGIGFAMKDVLNNFFYGVQLMSGRVRVGDIIECDGIRGTVVGLSYQSTQIEAVDDSVIIFTNTALFNKNFKNLTRSDSYQLVSFVVGVKYGTDVQKARQIILDALNPLMMKDKYGREVVNKKKGIVVRVDDFADSSVNLKVLMHTTVENYLAIAAQAREAIYNAFSENGIEIPFPQQDVYIKT